MKGWKKIHHQANTNKQYNISMIVVILISEKQTSEEGILPVIKKNITG